MRRTAILRELGTPLLIHQPSYSMLNRWIEPELLATLDELGVGCIGFSPLAQGMLTDKYLDGIPAGLARGGEQLALTGSADGGDAGEDPQAERAREAARAVARADGARVDAARPAHDLDVDRRIVDRASSKDSLGALQRLDFSEEELAEIDSYATDGDINLWSRSSSN